MKNPHASCGLCGFEVVPAAGIELATYALRVRCSTN